MTVKTILLRGDWLAKERIAGGVITPGHLVEVNTSDQLVVHSTAQGQASPTFARENEIVGEYEFFNKKITAAAADRLFENYQNYGKQEIETIRK